MRPLATSLKDRTYWHLRAWMASPEGQDGLARLRALGASWERDKAHLIAAGMAEIDGAPPMPRIKAFRDQASFVAGAAWTLALIANRARR
jgi:hypothetical protein